MENGEIIRMLRMKAGVKAIHLASKLGVTRSYLSQVENGGRPASDELLNKVCKMLGFSNDDVSNIIIAENSGVMTVGSPGAHVHNNSVSQPQSEVEVPVWAQKMEAEIATLREQLGDIQALLVKLVSR